MSGVVSSLVFPPDDGAAYLARVRGYVVPSRSGTARFVISSDDNSELWLSPGSDPFSRRSAAWIIGEGALGATKPDETHRFSSQWSAPVRLMQGQRYYLEVWHKQGGGPDHLSIRWQFEGDKEVSVVPAGNLMPYIAPPTDADDDGLPDEWQQAAGLAGRPDRGSWADPDGDHILNFAEFSSGTDPLNSEPVHGALLWERWHGINGSQIADLVREPQFAGSADDAELVRSGITPVLSTGNHASRLSGFIVPKKSGIYQLAVTGDDATELWFSDNESCHRKERVAFGTTWRERGNWDVLPCQRSQPLSLVAGQPYYIELLQKNGLGEGWAAIGWKLTDDKSFTTIPPEVLRSPGILPDDDKSDFLPDLWVTETLDAMDPNVRDRIVFTQQGDPDHDGLPNWLESRLNTDPFARSQIRETWVREWWFNVPGNSLDITRRNQVFLRPSSMLTLSHGPASEAYTADSFASRYRAYIIAPASGKYRLWIAGDDQVELWLSTTERKFHKSLIASAKPSPWQNPGDSAWTGRGKWDLRGAQQSTIIEMKRGQPYFIEVLHKDGGGDDHMEIAWQYLADGTNRWTQRKPVDLSALLSYDGDDDDGDDDYLPDSWERRYHLNSQDNGLGDPVRQGEDGDFDHDGLSNRTEFLLGTSPGNPDTDGDGETDFAEVFSLGTNPLVKDSLNDYLIDTLSLAGFTSSTSNWIMTSGGLISDSFRGEIAWEFTVPSDGFWLFRLKTELMGVTYGSEQVPMIVSVDGKTVVNRNVLYGSSPFSTLQALTPYLTAGRHTIALKVDNMIARRSVRLISLQLFAPPNAAMLLAGSNRIVPHPEFNRTSPACIEGYARMLDGTTVNGAPVLPGVGGVSGNGSLSFAADGSAMVTVGDGQHWYCNVPLQSHDNTQSYTVAFEQGFSLSGSISWQATNVLDGESLVIRQGDSLRLGAWTSNETAPAQGAPTTAILSSSGTSWQVSGRESVVVPFQDVGTFTMNSHHPNTGKAATLTVTVIPPPSFSAEPLDALGEASRMVTWKATDSVVFDANHEICALFVDRPTGDSAAVTLFARQPGASGVAARLGPGGPILAVQPLNVVGVSDALENDFTSQGTSPIPGYKLYRSPLTVTYLPDKGRVEIGIIRGGVMFPNGTVTRTIVPEDLANDWVDLEFLFPVGMPGAYCHTVSVYGRKGDYLGTR